MDRSETSKTIGWLVYWSSLTLLGVSLAIYLLRSGNPVKVGLGFLTMILVVASMSFTAYFLHKLLRRGK